jgi:hypothetical protein
MTLQMQPPSRVFVNYSNDTHVTLLCQDAE